MGAAGRGEMRLRIGAALILVGYLLLGLTFGLLVPPFENLDEIEHFGVVRHVAETGRLPVHGAPEAEAYHYRQEASQPPLYYLLSAALVRFLGLRADDAAGFWRFNPYVSCGPNAASPYDNRATFYHNARSESFPWRGALLMLHFLRAWSTLLQAGTVVGAYLLARRLFPRRRAVVLLAMAVVAFNPQFLLVASGVNNDNLVTPLVTWGLLVLLRAWLEGLSWRRALVLGLLIGLAGLSKLSGWLLLPFSCLAMLISFLRRPRAALRSFLISLVLVMLTALAVGGWWFWRNWQLYGDPTALQPMLELVGARDRPAFSLSVADLMFRSFWGQIPCAFYPPAFYWPYVALTALGVAGLVRGWRRLVIEERLAALGLVAWFGLVVVGWMRWDALTPATGGRLLFPALPAVALLLALGIAGLGRPRVIVPVIALALILTAWWTAADILPAFFAPPRRYPDAAAVQPDHPLDATFGDATHLMGYDLRLVERGPRLDLTLYWQAAAPVSDDLVLAIQLVSPVPGDTTLRWNYNSWPGRGNDPTSAWRPGEVIADRYRFYLPLADFPTQAWDVLVRLYRQGTGEALPVRLDGVMVGGEARLTRLRVPGREPDCAEVAPLSPEARFGEAVALTHAGVLVTPGGPALALCWQALQPLPRDLTVFVHLEDDDDSTPLTADSPPMGGAFPTSLWQPGDAILDLHALPSGWEGTGATVGLYDPADGSRLPATRGGAALPNGEVAVEAR